MESENKNIVSLETWRDMKSGRVPGFERPKLSGNLLDLLLLLSLYDETSDHRELQVVTTCDPLAWLDEVPICPDGFLDIGRVFGRPEIELPALQDVEDDPELCELWSFFEAFVFECSTVSAAINYIAQKKLPPLWRVDLSEGREIMSSRPSEMIDSVLIDYSLPFGGRGGVFTELLFEMPKRLSTIKTLQGQVALMIALLTVSRRPDLAELIVYLPTGSLFQEALAPCRRFLRDRMNLAAVIEMPPGTLQPSVGISCAVAIFQKKAGHTQTLFYNPSGLGELVQIRTQPWIADLKSALSGAEPRYGFLAEIDADDVWLSNRYLPKARGVPKGLMEFSDVKRIGDLFDIHSGLRFSRQLADSGEGNPIIRGRDIGKDSTPEDLERFTVKGDIPDRVRARSGDILIQKIGAMPKLTLVEDNLVGTIVGDTVLILRPHSPAVPTESVVQVLSSTPGKRLLAKVTKGEFAPTISIERLKNLEIPILSEDVHWQLNIAQKAEDQVRQIASRLTSIRQSIFVAETKEEFESKLLSVQTATKIVSSSLAASDDVNYRIRNFYPFPLAYPYRMLDGIVEPPILYKEQLRIAENIIAFVASIILALLDEAKLKSQVDLKKAFRGGISPGTWNELATQGASLLTDSKAGRLSLALKSLWKGGNRETNFFRYTRELIQIKNKFKHDRDVLLTAEEYRNGCARLADTLTKCMQELEFFVQFPIVLVTDLNIDRRTGLPVIDTLKYMGDHPALHQEKFKYPKALSKNTLFIRVEEHKLESLFPFVTVQNCPECHFREIYFIDGWDGKQARLKSFERGHPKNNIDVDNDFTSYFQI